MGIKRILINGITFEQANIYPILLNCRYWLSQGCDISFFGNSDLEYRISQLGILSTYNFIKLPKTKKTANKYQLIIEGVKRNLAALFYIKKFKGRFDIIYTRSSVLDLIIFPYFLRTEDPGIKWATVFDNTVPFSDCGNKITGLLAWFFFRISLIALKKADRIFVISETLRQFLISNGFDGERVILTGNGVERDAIRQAARDTHYSIDALFVGRINETKGIYDMLKILEIVRRKYPEFQLAIMGRGDAVTERNFGRRIRNLGLESNIQFLGYKAGTEKFSVIKSSKCFWFFSKSESFGVALLEAVCCGLPAFAYDLPPYKPIYKNNEVTIIEKNNYARAAELILDLFLKGDFKNAQGEKLLDRYNWDSIAEIEYNSF